MAGVCSAISTYPSLVLSLEEYLKSKERKVRRKSGEEEEEKMPASKDLLNKIKTKSFLLTLYILRSFLKITHWLTLVCQLRGVSFAATDRSIIKSKFAMKRYAEDQMFKLILFFFDNS
jgi:hypothetical protein